MTLPFTNMGEITISGLVPDWIIPTIGLLMSLAFFIIGKGYAIRLTAIGTIYDTLIHKLPEDFRRIRLNKINPNSPSNMRMSFFVVYLMSVLLTTLGVVLLIISIIK